MSHLTIAAVSMAAGLAITAAAAPLLARELVARAPLSMTHVPNAHGTYDRRLWLKALEPILRVGWTEGRWLETVAHIRRGAPIGRPYIATGVTVDRQLRRAGPVELETER